MRHPDRSATVIASAAAPPCRRSFSLPSSPPVPRTSGPTTSSAVRASPDGRPLGGATWRAEKGEIVARAEAAADGCSSTAPTRTLAIYTSVRCAEGCKAGVLLRAEATADGGVKGIYVSLAEGDLATYRVTLDAQAAWRPRASACARRRRPGARGAAPPPPPPPESPADAGRAGAAPTGAGRGGGRGGGFQPLQMPAGIEAPIRARRAPISSPATGTQSSSSSTPTSCARSSTTPAA